MASALPRLSSSPARTQPFLRSSLYYTSSLPRGAVHEKEKSRVTLNAPLEVVDPEIADIVELEKARQWKVLLPPRFAESSEMKSKGLELMPLNNSEGCPGARYYGGNEYMDMAESLCQKRALEAFRLDPAKWGVNVQSLSGSPANFQTDTKKISAVSIFFETMPYRLNESTGYIDYDQLEKSATLFRPKLTVAGASAYARLYDYARIRKVCDKHKAILLADMAHISGLVSAGVIPSSFEYADVVTTTTHKSLRGPRGAMIFFRKGVKEINKQGKEATTPEYKVYQEQVLSNCANFAQCLVEKGYELVSGGTENHLVLVNLKNKVLELVHIAANKNTVPGDVSAMVPGGIRMRTPALTSRGFVEEDFAKVADFFDTAVKLALKIKSEPKEGSKLKDFLATVQTNANIQSEIAKLRHEVEEYAKQFPTIGFDKETMKYKKLKMKLRLQKQGKCNVVL
ncbi:Interconversion of serine and glycine (By similarity) [Musa troglodytarum]|uniref:Serine hydroxymethyltransferase n=1 Tax=Musa troglodytarum TaxID=320322 RepID=A0A9E7J9M9_9LILI|nr:Interconversion of serine and glycine (By similarity) [Musa troglodytarum]